MTLTRSESLEAILSSLLHEGRFTAAVLTNSNGLPLASALTKERTLSDLLAAIAPVLEQAAQRSTNHTDIASADEIVIRDAARARLVCRFFPIEDQAFILAALVPPQVAYRRTMNQAIRAIQAAW